MICPICRVVVTDAVMKLPFGKGLHRCAQCGIHIVVGRPVRVRPSVKSSIGPITLPEVASGGNRLDQIRHLGPARRLRSQRLRRGGKWPP